MKELEGFKPFVGYNLQFDMLELCCANNKIIVQLDKRKIGVPLRSDVHGKWLHLFLEIDSLVQCSSFASSTWVAELLPSSCLCIRERMA